MKYYTMDGLDLQTLPVLDPGTIARLRPLEVDAPGMFGRLGTLFASESRAHLGGLAHGIAAADAPGMFAIAHRLTGAALTIGALRVAAVSGRIEALARRGEAATLGPLLAVLEEELSAALSEWVD